MTMKDREKIIEAMAREIDAARMRTVAMSEEAIAVCRNLPITEVSLKQADAAITALESELSALGLAILPVEATEEMAREGAAQIRNFMTESGPFPRTKAVYRAMTAAYLKKD